MIIAIEGIDGAGKNTLVSALQQRIDAHVIAFPRYADSIHAQLAARALHGQMGDLTDSVYGMATMFALDRFGAKDELCSANSVLLLDRYVASNAAYSAARLNDDSVIDWVYELEFTTLGLPLPDLQVLLDTPVSVAGERAKLRAGQDASRRRDAYELDNGLQARTADAYRRLAKRQWASDWLIAPHNADAGDVAEVILHRFGM
ncbi:dTMP kinase [Corynebacterium freiburgense]|uniref:dTMP kinase n=1 Tax=Corynebacterium freiburgense TaxID=556548 RepID=UPI0003FC6B5A|nr:dTMP kinase [Corynebacterium freiburgense]WJZ01913.1 Thymidylate kinase [Corynebacterium freiburgense]